MIHVVDSVVEDIRNMTEDQLNEVVHAIKMRRQHIAISRELAKQNTRKLMVDETARCAIIRE